MSQLPVSGAELHLGPVLGRPPWERGPHRTEFRSRLAALDAGLLAVAGGVAARIPVANRVLLTAQHDAVADLVAAHERVRVRCRHLEDEAINLVACQAPVAADLRELVAVLRAVHDVQRASKMVNHILGSLREPGAPAGADDVRTMLTQLSAASHRVFVAGVDAWRRRDGLAVNELSDLDDEVDQLEERLLARLYIGGEAVEDVIALALVSRWYERLADHGVALARHLSWAVTGDRRDA